MSRAKCLFSIVVVVLLGLGLTACSGGSEVSADASPEEVLNQTFGPEGAIESANINAEMSIEHEGDDGGQVNFSVSGPVQETEAEVPDMDIALDVAGQMGGDNLDFAGGLTLVGESGYVTLDGETYELDQAIMGQVKSQASEAQSAAGGEGEQGEEGLLGSFDPESFLTDLSNEGTTEINGEETVHISGTLDTESAAAELQDLMTGAAALQGLGVDVPGARELRELEETLGNVRFDIYTGSGDSLLRRMEFSVPVDSAGESGSLAVTVNLTDVNEELEIQAPANAKPFSALIGALASGALEDLGLDDLSELGDLGGLGGMGQGRDSSDHQGMNN